VKRLPRAVVALGVVSLLTDASSEMIYPLLPAFLVTLGASGEMIGAIDGVAETVAAVLKLASGWWADRVHRRKPLVLVGYGIAAVLRPLMALARAPWHVLAIRAGDRVGKGLRSSPRDAIIAAATPADRRGAAFGFHRAMDHTGALIGPLIAYALIGWLALSHRTVFLIAAIPGALALGALALFVREPDAAPREAKSREGDARLPARFWAYIACLALFTLGNASDFFLLMRAQGLGVPARLAPLLWALLHASKAVLSTPLSALSDRLGRRRVILAGWAVFALVYLGFGVAKTAGQAVALFVAYGAYFAFSEGAEKALVADLAPPEARGRAFGVYNAVLGICLLPASLIFGIVWDHAGQFWPFAVSAALTGLAAIGLTFVTAR
jgi:MFS family permease